MSSLVLLLSAHLLSTPAIEPVVLGANPLGPVVVADKTDGGTKKKKKKKEEGEED